MKNRVWWVLTAMLALALAGQIVVYRLQGPTHTAHASWKFEPKSLKEAKGKAKGIVLAEVVSVEPGEDLIFSVAGEPNNEDRIPTQRVTLRVKKGYKGNSKKDQVITLFQTGGAVLPPAPQQGEKEPSTDSQQVILEGDPLYQVGEQYILMVEPGPKKMARSISPEGRYRVEWNNTLTAMVENEGTQELRGKSLAEVEALLTAQD